jgi:hypothetical protein
MVDVLLALAYLSAFAMVCRELVACRINAKTALAESRRTAACFLTHFSLSFLPVRRAMIVEAAVVAFGSALLGPVCGFLQLPDRSDRAVSCALRTSPPVLWRRKRCGLLSGESRSQ